jgi:hypothetical protein
MRRRLSGLRIDKTECVRMRFATRKGYDSDNSEAMAMLLNHKHVK